MILIIGLMLSGATGYVIAINSISPQLEEARTEASSLRNQLSSAREELASLAEEIEPMTEELASLAEENETSIEPQPWGNAPDFTLIDLDGNSFKLSDFGGRVILLDFMATWCGPCRASMPSLLALHEEVGEEIVIISIGVDPVYDSEERLREWMNEWGAEWIHARDLADPPLLQLYGVTGIPTYVIVDRNGDIAFKHVGLTSGARLMTELQYLSE